MTRDLGPKDKKTRKGWLTLKKREFLDKKEIELVVEEKDGLLMVIPGGTPFMLWFRLEEIKDAKLSDAISIPEGLDFKIFEPN